VIGPIDPSRLIGPIPRRRNLPENTRFSLAKEAV
jgi:hypothetical protein